MARRKLATGKKPTSKPAATKTSRGTKKAKVAVTQVSKASKKDGAMSTLDKRNVTKLLERLKTVYEDFATNNNLTATQEFKAWVDAKTGMIRISGELGIAKAETLPETKFTKAWAKGAVKLGLKLEWLGRSFTSKGKTYQVVGLNPSSDKPVVVENEGKKFGISAATISKLFGAKPVEKTTTDKQDDAEDAPTLPKVKTIADRNTKVEVDQPYALRDGRSVMLVQEQDGKQMVWALRINRKAAPSQYITWGIYGSSKSDERRKFAERQLRKLALGFKAKQRYEG